MSHFIYNKGGTRKFRHIQKRSLFNLDTIIFILAVCACLILYKDLKTNIILFKIDR